MCLKYLKKHFQYSRGQSLMTYKKQVMVAEVLLILADLRPGVYFIQV